MDYVKWIRPKIGNTNIFLPCANCVIFNDAGDILLMQRSDFGSWATPGGCLDIGETFSDCVRREVREETGLEITDIELVSILSEPQYDVVYPNGDQTQQFTVNFRAKAATTALQMNDGEALALRWFSPDALPDNMLPWFKVMIADACRDEVPLVTAPISAEYTREAWPEIRNIVGSDMIFGVGAVVIVEHDGCILMTQRNNSGNWWFPAGFQMLGENTSCTAEREVLEETGIKVTITRFMGVVASPETQAVYANGDAVQAVSAVFKASAFGGTLKPQQSEVQAVQWMPIAEVAKQTSQGRFPTLSHAIMQHLEAGAFVI